MSSSSGSEWAAPDGDLPPSWSPEQPPPYPGPGGPPQGWAPPPGGPTGPGGPPPGPPFGAPKPGVVQLRPLTLGDIINGAFTYVRRNPQTSLGLAIVVMAVANLPVALGFYFMFGDISGLLGQALSNPEALDPDVFPYSTESMAVTYGGTLVTALAQAVVTALLTVVVARSVLGGRTSIREAWEAARPRLWAVVGVSLLATLVSVLLFGAVIGLVLGISVVDGTGGLVAGLVGIVGFIAAAVLTVWIYIRFFSMAVPAIVLERVGVVESIRRSGELVRRGWWRVFGILLLSNLLIYAISQILQLPLILVFGFALVLGPGTTWAPIVMAVGNYLGLLLVSGLTSAFSAGVTTLLYADLRMRREGLDLALRTAAAEAGPEGAAAAADPWRRDAAPPPSGPEAPAPGPGA